jgi:hypothetical protein
MKFSYLAFMRNLAIILGFILLETGNVGFAQESDHLASTYKFLENKGQWPSAVLYKTDLAAGKIWLEKTGILYQFIDASGPERIHHEHSEKMSDTSIYQQLVYAEFIDINQNFSTVHNHQTSEYYNFFLGKDYKKWASKVYGYGHITYQNIYDGIDLHYFEKNGQLKYEYYVQPRADCSQIGIRYHGQNSITLNSDGSLTIQTNIGKLIEEKPYAYQIIDGDFIEIPCNFILTDSVFVSFEVGKYNASYPLVLDPVIVFATYNGAVSDNFGMTATYGYDGSAYAGGTVYGNSYPITGPAWNSASNFTQINTSSSSSLQYGITDLFISKYSADGSSLLWTNILGGGTDLVGTETVHSLICDSSNNVYLFGATSSTDFPTMNAYQTNHAGGSANSNFVFNGVYYQNQGTDIFVSKFSEDGTQLVGSTYIGGSGNDGINYRIAGGIYGSASSYDSLTTNYGDQFRGEIMLDSMNNVLVASCTRSANFPIVNGFQPSLGGQQDGIVFKLTSDLSSLIWSSYFGGSANDACYSLKIDSMQNVFVAGGTSSNNIPGATGGLNPVYIGGKTDGFVFQINPDATTIMQSTYIGSTTYDQVFFIEIDDTGSVYILGSSNGTIPITPGVYFSPGSGQFIQKISGDLTTLSYSTVFGNGNTNPQISPSAFCIDDCGNIYASGWGANILQSTLLSGMPVTTDAFQAVPPDGFDFYLIALERDAQSLLYGTYIGSPNSLEHVDGGTSRFDANGILYQSICGGCGSDDNFPTSSGAWSSINNSANCNNVVLKFDFEIFPKVDFDGELAGCVPFTTTFNNLSNDTLNSVWIFDSGATIVASGSSPTVQFDAPGEYEVTLSLTDSICNKTVTKTELIIVSSPPTYQISNDTVVCPGDGPFNLLANSYGSATGFIWDDNIDFSSPINTDMLDSIVSVNPTNETTYYFLIESGTCNTIDSVNIMVGCLGTPHYSSTGVIIYPNPFGDYTTIYFGSDLKSTYAVYIYDATGREVYNNQTITGNELQINRNKMSSGIYLLSVHDLKGGQEIFSTKLIVE